MKSQELPEGTTGFTSLYSPRVLKGMAGNLLLVIGLILAMVFGPMFFITAR